MSENIMVALPQPRLTVEYDINDKTHYLVDSMDMGLFIADYYRLTSSALKGNAIYVAATIVHIMDAEQMVVSLFFHSGINKDRFMRQKFRVVMRLTHPAIGSLREGKKYLFRLRSSPPSPLPSPYMFVIYADAALETDAIGNLVPYSQFSQVFQKQYYFSRLLAFFSGVVIAAAVGIIFLFLTGKMQS